MQEHMKEKPNNPKCFSLGDRGYDGLKYGNWGHS